MPGQILRFYLQEQNARFAHEDHLPDIHRSPVSIGLNNIICFETTRYVHRDYTITVNARFIQLLKSPVPLPPPCHHVTIHRLLDGSLHIFWNNHRLLFSHLSRRPKSKPQLPPPAPMSHPWRDKVLGLKRKRYRYNKKLASKPKSSILPP